MSYEPGSLDAALSAALGNDAAMIAELRSEFCRSIASKIDQLDAARTTQEWTSVLHRLRGVSASFGATQLLALCVEALGAPVGDPRILRRMRAALRYVESSAGSSDASGLPQG